MFFVHFNSVTWKTRSSSRQLLHPYHVYPRHKFGDCRSVACRDNADISICYDALKVGQGDLLLVSKDCSPVCPPVQYFQVSVSSGYDLWHHLMWQTDPQTNGFCTEHMNSSAGWLITHWQTDTETDSHTTENIITAHGWWPLTTQHCTQKHKRLSSTKQKTFNQLYHNNSWQSVL